MKHQKILTKQLNLLLLPILASVFFAGSVSGQETPPLVGKYVAEKVTNDWHYAEISADRNGLKWSNKGGAGWRLAIQIDGAQPDKSWIVIGEGAPDSYKGYKLEVIKNESGAVTKLVGDKGDTWLRKAWGEPKKASEAAPDVRNDPANNGKNASFVKDGAMVEIYNKDEGVQKDGGPWILIKTADYEKGGVYRIKKEGADVYLSLDKGKLSMVGPTVLVAPDGQRTKDVSKIATWCLHLNSTGWSIMTNSNRANTISRTKEPETKPFIAKTNLQRNQGHPHQVWMIKQIGFVINPEL